MNQGSYTPLHPGARRRSQRVLMQVGVRIRGKDAQGKDFEEFTASLAINAHGALVPLTARLTSGGTVHMRHEKTLEEQECHVAFLGPARSLSSRRLDPQESRGPHGFGRAHKQVSVVPAAPCSGQLRSCRRCSSIETVVWRLAQLAASVRCSC